MRSLLKFQKWRLHLKCLHSSPETSPHSIWGVLGWNDTVRGICSQATVLDSGYWHRPKIFFVETLFLWIGIVALGVAMLGPPAFGKGLGGEYRSRGGRGRGCVFQIVYPGCSISLRLSSYHFPPLRMEGLQTLKSRVGSCDSRLR